LDLFGQYDLIGSRATTTSTNTGLDVKDGVYTVVGLVTLVRNVSVSVEAENFRRIDERKLLNVVLVDSNLSEAGGIVLARLRVSVAVIEGFFLVANLKLSLEAAEIPVISDTSTIVNATDHIVHGDPRDVYLGL
jgi:hypothetical protein